jgi:hypothetical protein
MNPQQLRLPSFEGRDVIATSLGMTGTIKHEDSQPARALRLDEEVVLVVVGTVSGVGFDATDAGVVRQHKVSVSEAFELDGDTARTVLAELREQLAEQIDARHGRARLPMGRAS